MVDVFAEEYGYDDTTAAKMLDDFLTAAGPALAPESEYAERIERRRERKHRKRLRQLTNALPLAQDIGREIARQRIDEWRSFYGRPVPRREK